MTMPGTHDHNLVILSVAVAIFASYTALTLARRIRASQGRARLAWLAAAAIALGGGIWSMHFVAMLSFSMPGMPMKYELTLTLVSLALAVGFTGAGLASFNWQHASRARIVIAGLLIATGVVAMHYLGMAAMRMPASLSYDWRWVAVSVIIAVVAATSAIWLVSRDRQTPWQLLAAVIMGAAIAGMHYAGMAAAIFTMNSPVDTVPGAASFSQTSLAIAVTVITVLILLLSLGAAQLDRMFVRAERREARSMLRLKVADILRGSKTEDALTEVAELLCTHFGVSRAGLGDLDPVADEFDYRICWTDGSVPPLNGRFPAAAFGVKIVAALSAGETVVIDDLFATAMSDEARTLETARNVDTRSILVVPFVRDGQLRTIVYLNGREPRAWRADEIAFMEEMAERIRLVIERIAVEDQLRQLNSELEARVEARTLELQHAEGARREVDALYRAYFENTPDSLFVIAVTAEGSFLVEQINPSHARDVGFALDRVQGRPVETILPPGAVDQVLESYRRVVETGEIDHRRDFFELNGGPQHWDTTLVPLKGPDGRVTKIMGASRNVTAQVNAEEALRQSQKLEAMGQLTGGVAHDFNNLLTPILGALDRLHHKGLGDERDRRLIAGALQSADRAKTLVHRLLSFARRQPLRPEPVNLSDLTSDMLDLVKTTVGPRVKVDLEAPSDVPSAHADANQIEMALLNLSVNARDAMPEGGTLRISVGRATDRPDRPAMLPNDEFVFLCVRDTGVGMDEQTRQRAIEPFFSTKGIGKGTGLGLSMAHGLAAQLGGALSIDSQPGTGTEICLWLPQSEAAAKAPQAEPRVTSILAGGRVLLVDDEDEVRESTAQMLEDLNFELTIASSAVEAWEMIRTGFLPEILITDHLMPQMSGCQLALATRRVSPSTRILVISGYTEGDGIDPSLPLLAKPFAKADLALALERLSADTRATLDERTSPEGFGERNHASGQNRLADEID
ncbi:PAS domain-containing protein [Sphingomonas sp. R647]|uniref:MHYT domain-containing protein n=1 Tax=Sphingomonas sp. R647 TaxID=2875233 RepID=UPI001CD32131|nr:MHYT domain-containing protein [Sphingomonas sp. R647]MCA1200184.1 PAS domain-containing protein [Sphingomonas sp. R647]